jgi:hypothetical protein
MGHRPFSLDESSNNGKNTIRRITAMTLSIIEHDRGVRHYAMRMLANGYEVKARVDGWFSEPDVICGYRPDIIARKGNEFVIVEIKKGEIDWPKIKALEAFASAQPQIRLLLITPEQLRTELVDV